MKYFIVILTLVISTSSFGQNDLKKIDLIGEYSWRNHSRDELNEYYFGLKPIKDSENKLHFRFQKDGQIIDIYSHNGIDFSGQLINEITEYKQVKSKYGKNAIPNNLVYDLLNLDKAKSNKIGQIIIEQKLYSLPTDKLIENWNFGWLDCGSVVFGFKLDSNLYSANYTCLWNQKDTIKFIKQIKNMYDYFIQVLDLQSKYSAFENRLEKGKTYSSDGFGLKYFWTKKQDDEWIKGKPQRDYQKSIKDSITNYLAFELNKQITNLDKWDCFDDFYLTYSKKGKFKKLSVNMKFLERNFDKDFQKCKVF